MAAPHTLLGGCSLPPPPAPSAPRAGSPVDVSFGSGGFRLQTLSGRSLTVQARSLCRCRDDDDAGAMLAPACCHGALQGGRMTHVSTRELCQQGQLAS